MVLVCLPSSTPTARSDYRGALDFALKVNMPGFWRTQLALATAYAQLGEREAARNAVRELLAVRPDFAAIAREELGKWWDPELIEHLIDGLRKAGLEIALRSTKLIVDKNRLALLFRWTIKLRSSSATALRAVKTILPATVLVSRMKTILDLCRQETPVEPHARPQT